MNGKPSTLEAEGQMTFPHGWFWPIAIVSLFGVIGVFAFADPTLSLQEKQEMLRGALAWRAIEVLLLCLFTHRLWKRLQDGETEITPGKAVGYLFIPFFGVYWFFQVWAGYATELNKFFAGTTSPSGPPRASRSPLPSPGCSDGSWIGLRSGRCWPWLAGSWRWCSWPTRGS